MHVLKRRATIAIALKLTLGASVGLYAQTQSRSAKSFLWKVQSGPRVLYLAGSVHALSADVYPLNPAFEQAFAASDTLVEELNLEKTGILAMAPMILSKAMYQDGRTFDKVVSKETAEMVATFLKGTPMGVELVRPMKPWMVMMLLSAMQIQQAGLNPALGLDQYFFDKATQAGKTVIGLETAASLTQLGLGVRARHGPVKDRLRQPGADIVFSPHLGRFQMVDAQMMHNGRQKTLERANRLWRRGAIAQIRLLHDVFCLHRAAQHPVGYGE